MAEQSSNLDIDRFLSYLQKAELSPAEASWLLEQEQLPELYAGLWALGVTVFDEVLCSACQTILPYYVQDQVMGEAVANRYPLLKAHLQVCKNCEPLYLELYRMLSNTYAAEIPAAASYPSFDLSFLTGAAPVAGSPWAPLWQRAQAAGKSVRYLFTEIPIAVVKGMASFGSLPEPLTPIAIPVSLTRSQPEPGISGQPRQKLSLPLPEEDLAISLVIGPANVSQAFLGIQVTDSGRHQPLPKVRVTIRDRDRRSLDSQLTDQEGWAIFRNLRITGYVVEVRYQGQSWEIPVTFSRQV